MSGLHFDSQKTKQQGKPDAGKPHVRFDEGEASRPWWAGTSLLYSKIFFQHLEPYAFYFLLFLNLQPDKMLRFSTP